MEVMECVILGAAPSKSNCYRVITLRGHGSLAKTKALRAYEQSFFLQCALRDTKLRQRFRLDLDVYYPSDRSDLDNSLKVVLDCLQQCKVIDNDRHCVEIVARKFVDKARPRVVIKITPVI